MPGNITETTAVVADEQAGGVQAALVTVGKERQAGMVKASQLERGVVDDQLAPAQHGRQHAQGHQIGVQHQAGASAPIELRKTDGGPVRIEPGGASGMAGGGGAPDPGPVAGSPVPSRPMRTG